MLMKQCQEYQAWHKKDNKNVVIKKGLGVLWLSTRGFFYFSPLHSIVYSLMAKKSKKKNYKKKMEK